MVRGPGKLLGGAEAGLQTIALPRGSLPGSQQPGRGCRPPNLPWSCPGKTGHSALLSADQRRGRGSCHHPAGCTDSGGGVGLSPDHHLMSRNLPSIHPRPLHPPPASWQKASHGEPGSSPGRLPARCVTWGRDGEEINIKLERKNNNWIYSYPVMYS